MKFDGFLGASWCTHFDQHHLGSLLECVIIEPRAHSHLGGVLSNISHMLPNAGLTVIHSHSNAAFVQDLLPHDHNVRLVCMYDDNIARDEYNRLLTSSEFWRDTLYGQKVLIFQTDTGVRKNEVLRYMEYDYIGAPWSWMVGGDPAVYVGNGGFSLRTRALMHDVCTFSKRDPSFKCHVTGDGEPEDIFFARNLINCDKVRLPSWDVASAFSMEHNIHPDPMGFHKAYDHHTDLPDGLLVPNMCKCYPLIHVDDAWVESEVGRIWDDDGRLQEWISLGVSSNGICLPEHTLIPGLPELDFGCKKFLKVRFTKNGECMLATIRLVQGRVFKTFTQT